jgi:hypothetical protein
MAASASLHLGFVIYPLKCSMILRFINDVSYTVKRSLITRFVARTESISTLLVIVTSVFILLFDNIPFAVVVFATRTREHKNLAQWEVPENLPNCVRLRGIAAADALMCSFQSLEHVPMSVSKRPTLEKWQ